MEDYRKMAEANQRRGREIIAETQLVESWEAIGAQANLIGSLSTGLMMKKLDIDMHVYTDTLSIKESFRAAARIASHPGIVRMEYTNLIDTEEECIEWHAAYRDRDGRMWKMDMIHIRRGSAYDGFAERMASRIGAVLTEDARRHSAAQIRNPRHGVRHRSGILRGSTLRRSEGLCRPHGLARGAPRRQPHRLAALTGRPSATESIPAHPVRQHPPPASGIVFLSNHPAQRFERGNTSCHIGIDRMPPQPPDHSP